MITRKQFDAVLQQLCRTRPGSADAHEVLRQLSHMSNAVLFGSDELSPWEEATLREHPDAVTDKQGRLV